MQYSQAVGHQICPSFLSSNAQPGTVLDPGDAVKTVTEMVTTMHPLSWCSQSCTGTIKRGFNRAQVQPPEAQLDINLKEESCSLQSFTFYYISLQSFLTSVLNLRPFLLMLSYDEDLCSASPSENATYILVW